MGNTGSIQRQPHHSVVSPKGLSSDGSVASFATAGTINISLTFEQLIQYVLPIYHTRSPLTKNEKDLILSHWKTIMTNQGKGYHQAKRDYPEVTPCNTSMEYFGRRLILRFTEVHPIAKTMLTKDPLKQGQLFMNMISLLVKEMDNPDVFQKHLHMLAKTHIKFGVRATEFGIFGEVLFWTLRLVLGEDYNSVGHIAWIKFYSRILEIVVPVILKYEIEQKESYEKRISTRMMAIFNEKKELTIDESKENEVMEGESTQR